MPSIASTKVSRSCDTLRSLASIYHISTGWLLITFVLSGLLLVTTIDAQRVELVVQTGHAQNVRAVVFSNDGMILASGGDDNAIKLWSYDRLIRTLDGHSGGLRSLSFSPDGKMLVSGSEDSTARIWEVETGRFIASLSGHSRAIMSVTFSPDGKTIATGSEDASVKLWDVKSKQLIRTIEGHGFSSVTSVTFFPDSQKLASGSVDRTVKFWDVRTGDQLRTLDAKGEEVETWIFSKDCKRLASITWNKLVSMWDVNTGKKLRSIDVKEPGSIALSADGKMLATARYDSVRLWDVETGKEIRSPMEEYVGAPYCLAFSTNGQTVAVGGSDNLVSWDLVKDRVSRLGQRVPPVDAVTFSSDGNSIASVSGNLKLWNLTTGDPAASVADFAISSVAFSPDGKTLAYGNDYQSITAKKETHVSKITLVDRHTRLPIRSLDGPENGGSCIAFSPDGILLASAGKYDPTVRVWDATSGKQVRALKGSAVGVTSVAFSADDRFLAVGSYDPTLRLGGGEYSNSVEIWDAKTWRKNTLLAFKDHAQHVSLAFSSNGKVIASGSGGTARLWGVETGQLIRSLEVDSQHYITTVAFSNDGHTLATSAGKTIKLWNTESGQQAGSLGRHGSGITALTFSPDSKILVSASQDATIKFWNWQDGKLLATVFSITVDNKSDLLVPQREEWVVATPEGRFDTDKELDTLQGLHWVMDDDPMSPRPLELFVRQYYEPNLLQRVLKCNEENNCYKEFKPLPSISEINRMQPLVNDTFKRKGSR